MRLTPWLCLSAALVFPRSAFAQLGAPSAAESPVPGRTLSGTVADPSGAALPGAVVHVEGPSAPADAIADRLGHFTISLAPGSYRLFITATGFEPFVRDPFVVGNKTPRPLVVTLRIASANEVVNVAGDSEGADAGGNASALVFKGKQLETLSDNDATLQQQLLAMAGGDGQHAPQIFVDGFSGGRFPPKSAIREVRINQNPYSAEYDGLGFGRIEIFTKPGSDKLHGFLQTQGNNDTFNAPNPFHRAQPPYHSLFLDGNLSGPLGKNTSFFLGTNYNDQQNNAVINATTLDPSTLQPVLLSQAVPNPQTTHNGSVRLDRQLTTNNTFTARYEYNENLTTNGGIGLLVLASEGVNSNITTQTLQMGNTEIIGAHKTNETRFQYTRTRTAQSAVSNAPALIVQGSFSGGGAPGQSFEDKQDRYELQDYFGFDRGKHFLRVGGRYRLLRDANLSSANYNGQFTFTDITAYERTLQGLAAGLTPTQIRAAGGGASQFTITQGQPAAVLLTGDIGLYAEDEWKVSKTVTLDLGFRFESQTAVHDHSDPAPRLGFAWDVHGGGKKPAWFVLRGGGGIFYDRIESGNLLTTVRQNGVSQLAYVVDQPDTFPNLPNVSAQPSVQPTIYRFDPHEHSPYEVDSGLSAERSLGKLGRITANYLNIRSVHYLVSINANAPLPGTYNPAISGSGVRPLGNQNIDQFTTAGLGRGNILFSNWSLQPAKWVSLWGFYVNQHFRSDFGQGGGFASNSYNIAADYARAPFTITNRVFTGASFNLPGKVSLEPFLAFLGGRPFNITTGADNNGDSIYNDRPAFATDLTRPSSYRTAFGNFDSAPLPTQTIIPANYGTGPGFFSLQLAASKSIKFGPRPKPPAETPPLSSPPGTSKGPVPRPDPIYELGFSAEAQNILNHTNGSLPIGVLTSPDFGKSIDLNGSFSGNTAANRTVNLLAFFRF